MIVGRIIKGGKFPVVTAIDEPPRYDWLRDDQGVEVLDFLSDNDGWSGERKVRTMINIYLAVPPDNIEITLI